jgi:hypothetical protein
MADESIEDIKIAGESKIDEKSVPPGYTKEEKGEETGNDLTLILKDGFRLQPQPTSDPLDPLNWTAFQKNTLLAIVMAL